MTESKARTLKLGTRGSRLALAQAQLVTDALTLSNNGIVIEIQPITTSGDSSNLPRGDGIFVKEIQRALLDGQIDLAVHSLKDIPTEQTEGLAIAAIPRRESPNEVMYGAQLADLHRGARVGTGSPRRSAQIKAKRRDLEIVPIRGNVPTRIAKVERGEVEATVLALAGLNRLAIKAAGEVFDPTDFLPAPGQGALAVEIRTEDAALLEILSQIDDPETRIAVTAERQVLRQMGGGCLLPIGVFGRVSGSMIEVHACVASADGSAELRSTAQGTTREVEKIVDRVVDDLIRRGAMGLL